MVSNPGYFSQMSSLGSLTQVVDGVDNPHTGLIKALSLGMAGNYVISGFDATSVTKTTATIADGVVLLDGKREAITGSGITLSTSHTTGYHLLVARSNALTLINPTAPDKVPEYAAGDVPIAILAHTDTNPMHIQYFGTGKTENSLSIARDASGVYTEVGTISGDANGILITGTTDVTLDGTNDRVYIKDATNNALKTVTPQSIADLKDISGKQDTISGASLTGVTVATDDKVLIQDTSDSDNLKTVTTQAIANLYTETQGLQDVTDNGTSTTDTITVGSLVSSGYIAGDPVVESGATIGGTDLYYFINTAAISLPPAASVAQRLFFVKNITSAACIITPQPGEFIDAVTTHAPTGITPNPDQRTAGAAITLESGESIILVAMTDSVSPLVNGYYVFSLDTDTGISNVVEDTTPQLGGMLDVNGNALGDGTLELLKFSETGSAVNEFTIANAATGNAPKLSATGGDSNVGIEIETKGTGEITLDGNVVVEAGHEFRSTRLDVVSLSATTTLSEATHAGKYIFVTGSGPSIITIPDNQDEGVHFTILSNDGNGFTLRTGAGSSAGDTMNGAQTDISVSARNGVTCISDGNNNYVVLGA